MKARTPSGPSTTQRENDVTSALTESGHERLRLPMELLWSFFPSGPCPSVDGVAQRNGSATLRPRTCFQRVTPCETVLPNPGDRRYLAAMLIGYARVSTDDQDTAAQVAALHAAGCERIFREKASGGRWNRPQLLRLLTHLRSGDVVVVWKLDRLSRSLRGRAHAPGAARGRRPAG